MSDENANVRSSSCRALGVFISFTSIIKDQRTDFLVHVCDLLESLLKDSNLNVRVRSSWAFANLCGTFLNLISLDNTSVDDSEYCYRDEVVEKLLRISISIANDNEKVSCVWHICIFFNDEN